MLDEDALNIYTDGSSFSSPRRGGVGMRFVTVDEAGAELVEDWSPPGYQSATNNQMELQACIDALHEVKRRGLAIGYRKIVIHTDSLYLCDCVKKAMFEWPSRKWMRRSGAPVLNADQWKRLVKAMKNSGSRVEFSWVKGHAKDHHNKAVDKLAKQSAKSPAARAPLSCVSVRRKKTAAFTEIGCVGLRGQRLTIRVITCEYLRVQHLWKLRYEVLSKASPYFRKVDVIYSDTLLKDGHSYFVRVNEEAGNPRITRVFREVSG